MINWNFYEGAQNFNAYFLFCHIKMDYPQWTHVINAKAVIDCQML